MYVWDKPKKMVLMGAPLHALRAQTPEVISVGGHFPSSTPSLGSFGLSSTSSMQFGWPSVFVVETDVVLEEWLDRFFAQLLPLLTGSLRGVETIEAEEPLSLAAQLDECWLST